MRYDRMMSDISFSTKAINRAGFSLMELLVVISIIALLAALLIPTIGMIRRQAESTACTAALRQIALAAIAYPTDNEGFLAPLLWDYGDGNGWHFWQPTIAPYLDQKEEVIWSEALNTGPSAIRTVFRGCKPYLRSLQPPFGPTANVSYGYVTAVNMWRTQPAHTYQVNCWSGLGNPQALMPIAQVEKPSNAMLAADANQYWLPHMPWAKIYDLNFPHNSKGSAAMFDGRVVTLEPQASSDSLWNPDALTR